jgi:hypothetical protein
MQLKQGGRTALAGLVAGVLVGGVVAAVTPAGAAVKGAAAAAIDWKATWKTEIKPRADKRYYKKKDANKTFVKSSALTAILSPYITQTQAASALANYYTKAQSDANYYSKAQSDANYYTKAQSDAKYAPAQPLYRGTLMIGGVAAGVASFTTSVSFGATFSAAPTVHYIKLGDAIPAGCSGSAAAPNAAAGQLCVFESEAGGPLATNRGTCRAGNAFCSNTADPWGFGAYAYTSGAGQVEVIASWAARPLALANPSRPGPGDGINGARSTGPIASSR